MRARSVAFVALAVLTVSTSGAPTGRSTRSPTDEPTVPVTIRIAHEEPAVRTARASRAEGPAVRSTTVEPARAIEEPTPAKVARTDPGPPGVIRVWHVMYTTTRPSDAKTSAKGSPCPNASTCDSNGVREGRWPTEDSGRAVIPFAFNDEGRRPARAADGLAHPALSAAMNEWMRWNSNVVFRDEGTTDATFAADGEDGTCADGTNVITWGKFSPEVIGAAVLCFDRTGRVIRDADLALNATQHWERMSGEAESRHSHDIQAIYTHELGHWLSLQDLYTAESERQTMHGGTQYEEFHKRTLARGDILGVQKAYPCGGGDRCPSSGIKDD